MAVTRAHRRSNRCLRAYGRCVAAADEACQKKTALEAAYAERLAEVHRLRDIARAGVGRKEKRPRYRALKALSEEVGQEKMLLDAAIEDEIVAQTELKAATDELMEEPEILIKNPKDLDLLKNVRDIGFAGLTVIFKSGKYAKKLHDKVIDLDIKHRIKR